MSRAIQPVPSPEATLYERDFYAWANEQTALLRAGKLAEADLEHIAEEIESMGKTEKRELANRLAVPAAASAEMAFSARPSWRLVAGHHPRAAPRPLMFTWLTTPA